MSPNIANKIWSIGFCMFMICTVALLLCCFDIYGHVTMQKIVKYRVYIRAQVFCNTQAEIKYFLQNSWRGFPPKVPLLNYGQCDVTYLTRSKYFWCTHCGCGCACGYGYGCGKIVLLVDQLWLQDRKITAPCSNFLSCLSRIAFLALSSAFSPGVIICVEFCY